MDKLISIIKKPFTEFKSFLIAFIAIIALWLICDIWFELDERIFWSFLIFLLAVCAIYSTNDYFKNKKLLQDHKYLD